MKSEICNLKSEIIPSPAPPAGWFSSADAAGVLGLTVRTVRRQAAAGQLVGICVKGQWYIDPACSPALKLAAGDTETSLALTDSGLAGLSASQRQRGLDRMEIVLAYRQSLADKPADCPAGRWLANWTECYNIHHPTARLSARTLRRWLGRFARNGIAGMVERRGGARTQKPFTPEAREFILGCWLSENRPSLTYIYAMARGQARQYDWAIPSLRTVRLWLKKQIDPKLIAAGRDPKRYRDRCLPTISRDWPTVPAMDAWVADHRQFDVLLPRTVWDKKRRREEVKWFRPWLTLWLDARSWQPVGWCIDFDTPNADRVMGSFGQAVERHGCPQNAILDNGKDFRAHDFSGGRLRKIRKGEKILNTRHTTPLLEALGVTVHWALPHNARAKIIEPFFRLVAEGFDKLWPTYCGNTPARRPERLKRLRADRIDQSRYNLAIFREAFAWWVEKVYSLSPSPAAAAGGRSALRAFCELRSPDFRPVRPATETLSLLLTRSKRIRVSANGVYVHPFAGWYWSDALEPRRAASGRDIDRHVVYRYRPDDASRVWVFDFRTDKFLAVATPYIGGGIHPLAKTDDDAERLSDAMALQRGLAKRDRKLLAAVRSTAAGVLMDAYRRGLAEMGQLDDPATIKRIDRPPVIRFLPEADRAAAADRRLLADRRRPAESIDDDICFFADEPAVEPDDEPSVWDVFDLDIDDGAVPNSATDGGTEGRHDDCA